MTTRREDPDFIGPEVDRRHASPFWLIGVLEGTLRSHRSGIRTSSRALKDLETGLLVHDVARAAYPGER